jgi:hypothetical protein
LIRAYYPQRRFASNSGSIYSGGSLFWEEDDTECETLYYDPGRVSSARLTRYTKDEQGNDAWFRVTNTTAWLVSVGATGWGKRSEYSGFEVHDFSQKAIFVLFTTWLDRVIMNCRTSNAPRVPDPGPSYNERYLNDGRQWSGFQTYDHLMQHILTDWRISNCGGVARGLAPWVEGGLANTGSVGLFTIPVNGFAPEVQLISKGTTYDWDTVGGRDFLNESIFFAGSGSQTIHSMQYISNWEDADGSMTDRGVPSVLGPRRAGSWWHLDFAPGRCEEFLGWHLPHWACDKLDRNLASMFTVVMPQGQYPIESGDNYRSVRSGSMTHFGLEGDGSPSTCAPPETCGETTSRSWDPDITGPYDHSQYGGWYLAWDGGTPTHLNVMRIQMPPNTAMVQAMGVPAGTRLADVHVWAESVGRTHNYTHAASLQEVRDTATGDRFWLDTDTNTLFWRVITGYVYRDLTFDWMDREAQGVLPFTRAGLTVQDITTQNQFQLHIELSCDTDDSGYFCATKPTFLVPDMGCPAGEVMVAIDACGPSCVLTDSCPTQDDDDDVTVTSSTGSDEGSSSSADDDDMTTQDDDDMRTQDDDDIAPTGLDDDGMASTGSDGGGATDNPAEDDAVSTATRVSKSIYAGWILSLCLSFCLHLPV